MKDTNMADLLANGSLEDLINYCEWNDRNGCYSDVACDVEGLERPTIEELRSIIQNWVDEG